MDQSELTKILHDLTMVYLDHRNLSGKTPAEIYDMYRAAFLEIKDREQKFRLESE